MNIAQNRYSVKHKSTKHDAISHNKVNATKSKGYCLRCGAQVSMCGLPFSDEIACPKCGAVNVYENSQQPKCLKGAV